MSREYRHVGKLLPTSPLKSHCRAPTSRAQFHWAFGKYGASRFDQERATLAASLEVLAIADREPAAGGQPPTFGLSTLAWAAYLLPGTARLANTEIKQLGGTGMALIDCPECGHRVSDKAATCPSCGFGIAMARETAAAGQELTTVQHTTKRLKTHSLISFLIGAFGTLLLLGGLFGQAPGIFAAGFLIAFVGLGWFTFTQVRVWWHHG